MSVCFSRFKLEHDIYFFSSQVSATCLGI